MSDFVRNYDLGRNVHAPEATGTSAPGDPFGAVRARCRKLHLPDRDGYRSSAAMFAPETRVRESVSRYKRRRHFILRRSMESGNGRPAWVAVK